MSLAENGEKVIGAVRKLNPSAQAEAYVVESESRAQEWSEGRPENSSAAQSRGIGLRVIDSGRLGFGSMNRIDEDALDSLGTSTLKAAQVVAPNPHLGLVKPAEAALRIDLELVDPSFAQGSFEQRATFLASLE